MNLCKNSKLNLHISSCPFLDHYFCFLSLEESSRKPEKALYIGFSDNEAHVLYRFLFALLRLSERPTEQQNPNATRKTVVHFSLRLIVADYVSHPEAKRHTIRRFIHRRQLLPARAVSTSMFYKRRLHSESTLPSAKFPD